MRKLSRLIMLLVLSVVLASCTVGEEDPEPTEEPTAPSASTTLSEEAEDTDVGIPGTPEFDVEEDATPGVATAGVDSTPMMTNEMTPAGAGATPPGAVATPAEEMEATPEGVTRPLTVASPVATPQPGASPAATPMGSGGMVVPPPAEATAAPSTIGITGTIVLNGNENEAYVLTSEGCVGLGQYAGLHEARQVVIRDATGTIVSVTTMETASDAEGCAWEFWASVPESEFYAVSVPMEFEQVFPKGLVVENNGKVTIELP